MPSLVLHPVAGGIHGADGKGDQGERYFSVRVRWSLGLEIVAFAFHGNFEVSCRC